MMDRRIFLTTVAGLLAAPPAVEAQQAGKAYRIGWLRNAPAITPEQKRYGDAIGQGLREQGFVEGQNLVIESRYAEGRAERFAEFAAEAVRNRVDVIFAVGPQAAMAAARATKTIPIVFWGVPWPVEHGLASSLARPGGNVTGMAFFTGLEVVTKQLEFLKEIAPKTARLAWITPESLLKDVAGREVVPDRPVLGSAARTLGMEWHELLIRQPKDFDATFARILKSRMDAVGLAGDVVTYGARKRIVEFANQHGLPSTFGMKDFVVEGGLLSYGADLVDMSRKSGTYLGRILKGSNSGDLPIEQPTKFELVINRASRES
jgi:putative ABC transport system substrate-binding protein